MADNKLVPKISKEITIDGETFCLAIVPKASTKLVTKARDLLSADLDLLGFVEDRLKLGSFARVAYHGVTGCTELQLKVQKVAFTVVKLCQESDITVALFKKACTEVIETLQSAYEYLLDGFEDIAVINLKMLREVTKKMAVASEKLKIEFDKATDMVETTLNDTMTEKGKQVEKEKVQKKQEEEKMREEQEKIKQKEAAETEERKRAELSSAARKQDQAEANLDEVMRSVFDRIVPRIFRLISGEVCPERDTLKEAREERLQTLREIDRQSEEKLKATLELENCVLRMEQAKVEEGLAESAIAALHSAQCAEEKLKATLEQASRFWRRMYEHCKEMDNEQMVEKIEKQMNKPEATRLKLWGSRSFTAVGVKCYAKWVALEDVCTTYRDQIRGVEGQLYSYLKENPTTEEARQMVPTMAMALKDDLEKTIAKMNKKGIEDRKEMDDASKETVEEREAE